VSGAGAGAPDVVTPEGGAAPLLQLERVVRRFVIERRWLGADRTYTAVDDVSLQVRRGAVVGLIGESGSGKSTVGRMALGLLPTSSGRVVFDGVDLANVDEESLRRLRRRMQLVFQDPRAALNPRLRIVDAVAEPFVIHEPSLSPAARRERAVALLQSVGLGADHGARLPTQLSGGQLQRVVIARALALRPELIVADEPVSALDVSVQAQIVNMLGDVRRAHGLAYLFISHDLRVVEHLATDVVVLYRGRVMERGPAASVFATARHPYTQALLAAVPDPTPGAPRLRVLSGDAAVGGAGLGCPFLPRCARVAELDEAARRRCREERPTLGVEPHAAACHHASSTTPSRSLSPASSPARR
jgi:oligopeptide/dipeptide ABC transporter ATP-binding protein